MNQQNFFISDDELLEFLDVAKQIEEANTEDFLELAKIAGLDPKKDFVAAKLSNVILRAADLSGANLSGADLSNADLSSANLSGANLSGANLSSALLINVDFRDTQISESTRLHPKWLKVWKIVNRKIDDSNLRKADLSFANLRRVTLMGFDLQNANLSGTDLSGASLWDSNLSSASLSSSNLRGADIRNCNLSGATFSNTIVKNAIFRDARGLTEDMKRDLEKLGAIFSDRPPVTLNRYN